MEVVQKTLMQLLAAWNRASRKRQVIIVMFATLTALAVGSFAYLSSNGEYRQLFGNLPSDEVEIVAARLKSMGIPYRVEGAAVLVPEERLVAARAMLAQDGIPSKGGKGFELFDDAPLGMTPFAQNVNYTRALQTELARLIMQLEPIAAARVIIKRTDPTPFIREQRPSSASVVLKLKNGANLSRSTAAGIVGLVTRAVDGVLPEYVALLDSTGRVLSDAQPGDPTGELASQHDSRRTLEGELARKAEDMLARHLGPGRAIVRITADMSTQRIKERRETYSPEDKVVASERTMTAKTASPTSKGGSAGTGSNLVRTGGGGNSSSSNGGNGSTNEETSQTEYLVSKSVREFEDRAGGVQRLTVAAMIDLKSAGEGAEGRTTLSQADAEEIIKQAIGFRTGRDQIKVRDVTLAGAIPLKDVEEDAAQIQKVALYVNMARHGALGIGFLTALAMVWMLFRRAPVVAPAVVTKADDTKKELDRFVELAERDPERLANLLESLMGDPIRA